MSELLEKTHYDDDQYFKRKTVNHYNYNQPIASPNNSESIQEDYRENSQINVVKKKWKLSKFEISWIALCSILVIGAIAISILIRNDMTEKTRAINALEDSITEYRSHTDVLNSQITEQFNYQQIQKVAGDNNMTIEKDRVRTVEK